MADSASARELAERYPVLEKLGLRRHARRIPIIQQLHATECGAACLAMVLGYHGKTVRLEELRSVMQIGRDGSSVTALLDAARWFGLRGRGVRLDLDELQWLTPGTILHWDFNHFVVFERVHGQYVEIVDPALGRRRVTLDQFDRSFTGVGLLLDPSDTFTAGTTGARPIWKKLRDSIAQSGQWARIITTSLLLQLFALALPVLTGAVVDRVVPRG
ncbi:MAG TPA: cysteine peptidase family C39 domain-containing protein, partial [Polyangia bacterium]